MSSTTPTTSDSNSEHMQPQKKKTQPQPHTKRPQPHTMNTTQTSNAIPKTTTHKTQQSRPLPVNDNQPQLTQPQRKHTHNSKPTNEFFDAKEGVVQGGQLGSHFQDAQTHARKTAVPCGVCSTATVLPHPPLSHTHVYI